MIEFPYLYRRNGLYPVIPLTLARGQKIVNTEALIDSGANISLFHSSFAEYLGIKPSDGTQIYLEGIGGRVLGWIHGVEVLVGERRFKLRIVFSAELITSFNLLGRDNFFDIFTITFKEREKIALLV